MVGSVLPGISGRVDTGFLVQVIHLQAGIVRQNQLTGQLHNRPGFDDRIFFKCITVLHNIHMNSCVLHGQNRHVQIFEYLPYFSHFPFITGSKNNFLHLVVLVLSYSMLSVYAFKQKLH